MGSLLRNLRSRRFVAVDFDSQRLRLVHAEQVDRHARILKLGDAPMPSGLDPADAEAIGECLGRTLKEMGLARAEVVMNVPRGQAVLKPLALPQGTTNEELPGMVQYQVQNELPFPGAEAVIDFTIEHHYDVEDTPQAAPPGMNVLVAAVRLPVVEHYRQIALTANVKLRRLGLRPYANHRCVETCVAVEGPQRLAVVHLTADETEIDVLEDGALAFSRSAVVKVPPAHRRTAQETAASIAAVATEVARSLQSYQAVERGGQIDRVLVAGGTGIEPRAAEELARRLRAPCEIFDPSGPLRLREGQSASAFIAALGLAVGHGGLAELPFDFVNPKRPRVQRDTRKLRRALAAAAVLVALLTVVGTGWAYLAAKSNRLAERQTEYDRAAETNKRVRKLAESVRDIESWQRGGRTWLDHWAYITCLFPSCEQAYITDLRTLSDGSISFAVRAHSSDVLAKLQKRLEEAKYDYKLERLATKDEEYGYDFGRVIKIMVPPNKQVPLSEVAPAPRPKDDAAATEFGRRRRPTTTAARPPAQTPAKPPPPTPAHPGGRPSEAKIAELRREILRRADRNHNGRIEGSEHRYAHYYVERDGKKVFDTNGDGKITGDEQRAKEEFRRSLGSDPGRSHR